ncbi:MAG: phage terminase small subunit [Caenibius sp.]
MFSPALRHRQKKLAQIAAIKSGKAAAGHTAPPMPDDSEATSEYQQLLTHLHNDLRTLHGIQSNEAKAAKKAQMIKAYLPWVEGTLAIEEGQAAPQDEIVVTALIWAIDIREWELALDLLDHVHKHALQLPERFHRSPRGLVWSEMADVGIKEPGSVPVDLMVRAQEGIDTAEDVKDETKARFYRAVGEAYAKLAEDFDPNTDTATAGGKPALVDTALNYMTRALSLDDKVGVKKPIEQLTREARKLADAAGEKEN